jgi:hypothetical protein
MPRHGRFTRGKRTGGIGGWVGPRAGVNGCRKFCPQFGFDSRTVHTVETAKLNTI